MLRDLELRQSIFDVKYAPKEWKKKYINWTLEAEIAKARQKIDASPFLTVKGYQKILRAFFQSFCDHHVGILFHSTETAVLPFSIKNAGDKYFVTEANQEVMELMRSIGIYDGEELLTPGCQLLQFDGEPIDSVIEKIKKEQIGFPQTPTTQHLANQILTMRLGQCGHFMPEPFATLQFRTPAGKVVNTKIEWIHIPEEIIYKSPLATGGKSEEKWPRSKRYMLSPLAMAVQAEKSKPYGKYLKRHGISKRSSAEAPPPMHPHLLLGEVIWQEEEPSIFQAYIYASPRLKRNIGYIRIATYMPSEIESEVTQLVDKLAGLIRFFEENTDALIVDQVDNGGGLVFYGYAIASLLTDRPLTVPWHRMTLTHKEVRESLRDAEMLKLLLEFDLEAQTTFQFGYPCDRLFYSNALEFGNFILSEWMQDKHLTECYPLFGIAELNPHPSGRYSHPLMVLINGNDFSGADFIPAILQDNQRALLFGEQTAGAGGCVEFCTYPNLFGVATFSYTSSFALRGNGAPLENLGVTPDIPYNLSESDLMHDCRDYKQAINDAIEAHCSAD